MLNKIVVITRKNFNIKIIINQKDFKEGLVEIEQTLFV